MNNIKEHNAWMEIFRNLSVARFPNITPLHSCRPTYLLIRVKPYFNSLLLQMNQ